jgi:hypothetical protein
VQGCSLPDDEALVDVVARPDVPHAATSRSGGKRKPRLRVKKARMNHL